MLAVGGIASALFKTKARRDNGAELCTWYPTRDQCGRFFWANGLPTGLTSLGNAIPKWHRRPRIRHRHQFDLCESDRIVRGLEWAFRPWSALLPKLARPVGGLSFRWRRIV